jgi:hypothetical protein
MIYNPIVCQFKSNGSQLCDEKFFGFNFFVTHLKSEHNIISENMNINEQKKFYRRESIPLVEQSIEKCITERVVIQSNNKEIISKNSKNSNQIKQNMPQMVSDKRKSDSSNNSMQNQSKKRMTTNDKYAEKSAVKRRVGRPRKTTMGNRVLTDSKQSNSGKVLRKSTSSGRSRNSIKYNEYESDNTSDSEWNSDVECIEKRLSFNVSNKSNNKSLNGSQVNKSQSKRIETELNSEETESLRSESQENGYKSDDEIYNNDDMPVLRPEIEPQINDFVENCDSSTGNLPNNESHQNSVEGNASKTRVDPISSSISDGLNQNIGNNLVTNQNFSGIGLY